MGLIKHQFTLYSLLKTTDESFVYEVCKGVCCRSSRKLEKLEQSGSEQITCPVSGVCLTESAMLKCLNPRGILNLGPVNHYFSISLLDQLLEPIARSSECEDGGTTSTP